jgi:4-hydroxybenzoate polyprenyltransferase
MQSLTVSKRSSGVWPYIQIARVDHWFKNVFMMLGVLVALFSAPGLMTWTSAVSVGLGFIATCLVASSNYVINEVLDGPRDRLHPEKRHRPVPSGLVRPAIAYLEWIGLGLLGGLLAWQVNGPFTMAAGVLVGDGRAVQRAPGADQGMAISGRVV